MLNASLALVTAGLLIATFPRFDIVLLAPVALAPLLFALARQQGHLRRFLLGYVAGVVYWFGVCYWIQFVLLTHGGMGVVGSWAAFLLFCSIKALHMGMFGLAAGAVMGRVYAVPAVAALWVASERTHGPLGFAWLTLGNAGIDMAMPLRLAPYTGVYGLSFVFAMTAAGLAVAALRRRRELLWLASLLALYIIPSPPPPERGEEEAVLVQPNLDETERWTQERLDETKGRIAVLSLQAALSSQDAAPPRLILWPEVPAPFYYFNDPDFREQVTNVARITRAYLLFGTVAYSPDGRPLNSAVFLSPGGNFLGRYDKMFLVPFGEFVPRYFGFVERITSEAGDFQPGEEVVTFWAEGRGVGTFICYESVFPHLVRRFVGAGAEVLVNLSNDGYFGRTAARDQHLKIARMRAVENRRWLLRATNDGITATIDPAGRIVNLLESFNEAAVRTRYSYIEERTPYTRFGDWFAWLCAAGGIVAVGLSLAPRYRPQPGQRPATRGG